MERTLRSVCLGKIMVKSMISKINWVVLNNKCFYVIFFKKWPSKKLYDILLYIGSHISNLTKPRAQSLNLLW